MKNIDTTTGEVIETAEKKNMTAKERNRAAQFERLLKVSAEARQIRDIMIQTAKSAAQAIFLESQPLNYFILKYVYTPAQEGTTDFKKFNEWKQEGYTIIKGSKAFPVWSQPSKRDRKGQETENEPAPTPALMENADGTGDESGNMRRERERFNMCYLFSNLQVTRRDNAAAETETETAAETETAPAPLEQSQPIEVF